MIAGPRPKRSIRSFLPHGQWVGAGVHYLGSMVRSYLFGTERSIENRQVRDHGERCLGVTTFPVISHLRLFSIHRAKFPGILGPHGPYYPTVDLLLHRQVPRIHAGTGQAPLALSRKSLRHASKRHLPTLLLPPPILLHPHGR